MFLILVSLLMISSYSVAGDFFGDPNFVARMMAMQQEANARMQSHFNDPARLDALHNDKLVQNITYMTSFFGATYAFGGFCAAHLWGASHRLRSRLNAYQKMAAVGAVCIGAYAGYQVPMEVWQATGDAEKMMYGLMLADIGSVIIGTLAGRLSS
jgi:hypothetical protein